MIVDGRELPFDKQTMFWLIKREIQFDHGVNEFSALSPAWSLKTLGTYLHLRDILSLLWQKTEFW